MVPDPDGCVYTFTFVDQLQTRPQLWLKMCHTSPFQIHTQVRHEEWSSWLDYKIGELIDVLAGKASGRGVEEGEQWKCRYCAFRPSAQQGPVTCGGGGGYVQGVEEADDDAGLTCTWPIAAAGT